MSSLAYGSPFPSSVGAVDRLELGMEAKSQCALGDGSKGIALKYSSANHKKKTARSSSCSLGLIGAMRSWRVPSERGHKIGLHAVFCRSACVSSSGNGSQLEALAVRPGFILP